MFICQLNGDISNDTVVSLISYYNEAIKLGKEISIYLNSEGGDTTAMECIIHLINSNKSITTLIGYGELYSAAFFIFFRAECATEILPGTSGMCHFIRTSIEIDQKGKAYYQGDQYPQKWMKDQNTWTNDLCVRIGMTTKEISRIKKREEVYFPYNRMLELLNYKGKENSNGEKV